jgi:hypothetical protein
MRVSSLGSGRLLSAAFALSLHAAAARAQPPTVNVDDYINPDRPGIADGSYVVGAGRFQIETGVQQEYRRGDAEHSRTLFVPTLLRLGLTDRVELRVEGSTYSWKQARDPLLGVMTTDGTAPTSIGLKLHFIDPDGASRPSVGAILRVFPPSGSGAFRTGHTTGDLRLVADWDFAPQWSLNPNLGAAVYEDNSGKTYAAGLFAMTLNYNPSKVLNFFVDTSVQYPEARNGRSAMIVDIGTAFLVGRNTQLDLSVGWGTLGRTTPRLFLAGGISQRF